MEVFARVAATSLQQRQTEDALLKSEERFRLIAESSSDVIFQLDLEGRVTYCSPAAERILGFAPEEVTGAHLTRFFPKSRQAEAVHNFEQVIATECVVTLEAEIIDHTGSPVPTEVTLAPIKNNGHVVGVQGHARDVTERKQMEEEIEGERAFLAAVIDNIEEAVIICDDEGRITRFNEAARQLHGLPERPILPDQWAEYYDLYREDGTTPLSKEEIPLFRALQGERVHNVEIVVNPEHGEPRSLVCNGQAMVDESGQLTGAVVTMHDITARKQAERELRQLATVVDLSPDDIAITDMEGKITYANPAMASLHGLDKAEEAIGTNAFEWFVSPDKAQAAMQETLEKGGITNREFEILNKRGESVPVEMSVTVLWDENDQPTGFAAITRDITARKRAEEALRESEQWLSTTLKSIGDAVIATDDKGQIRLMNPVAESLTGWDEAEALGQPLEDIFHIVNERTGAQVESPASKVFREGKIVGLANHTALINRNGRRYSIADSAAPIEDQDGNIIGAVLIFRDVTERREREKRLAFQSLLLDQIQDMVTATDLEGRITYVNQAECRAFGKTADDLIGQHIEYYGEDGRRGATQQEIIETTRTEGEWRGEVVNVTDSGREIVLDCRTRLLRNEHGEPVGMVGVSTDITERKRMEEELALQSQLWDALMANTPDLVYFKDADHSIIRASHAYAEAVGLDVEEVVGKTTAELWPHEAEEIIADERRVLAGDPLMRKEREVTTASGESRWYLLTKVPIYQDNEVMGFFATDKDITERKRVEEALKESESKLRGILSSMVDLVFALDREGRYTYYHTPDSGVALYASPDEFMGKRFVEIMPARLRDLFTEAFDKNQEGETADCEYWLEMDGEQRWFSAKLSPRIVEGDFVGSVAVVRDITKRKRAEEEIERRAAELKRSNRDLEQFAHVISHDMQEPLRTVTSWLQLLEKRYRGEMDEKADKYIDHAVKGAERMQEMIKALLELSRIGTQGKEPAPTDVEAVLERTLNALGRAIEEAEADVTRDPLPTVMADEAQLAQVFQNLIANAIKFRKENVPPRVHVSAEQRGDEWVFSVADNGIGIDPEQSDHIFQIFQRLHTEEEYPGLGMGLALCKRIVERHGGRIWVESEPGEGSTFTFTLPTKETEPLSRFGFQFRYS
jgi:PAS domain S-box-containing protein